MIILNKMDTWYIESLMLNSNTLNPLLVLKQMVLIKFDRNTW